MPNRRCRHSIVDMTEPKFRVKPVTASTWADMEALFEAKGSPKYCWCMAWRAMENRSASTNADRKDALHERIRKRKPIGLLGYLDGEPVAWCSVAPRDSYLRLSDDQDDDESGVWSIVCFFVRRQHRGEGLSEKMLDAAIALARKRGAKVVEGYPVDPESPSYRYMGFVKLFRAQDFKAAGKAGTRRHVMRKSL